MSRLPLQTLPTFDAVARCQNLRQAAEDVHLTPSAVSQQIRLLEEQLGFALFDRRGRRVVLNAAGTVLQTAVQAALELLRRGQQEAQLAARGESHRLRLTMLNSLAQRWLLPRMAAWRAAHPNITLDLHVSPQVVDLQREGYHAALRQGLGPWKGMQADPLFESAFIAVGSPAVAERLRGADVTRLAQEPLLGDADIWRRWFALHGHHGPVNPVAQFNDAALMLQAAEQDIGIALARELLAADALRDGQLVRLAGKSMSMPEWNQYWLVYPPEHAQWPPLLALRSWLHEEIERSTQQLRAPRPARDAAPGSGRAGKSVKRKAGGSAESGKQPAPAPKPRALKPGTAAARR